MPGRQLTAPRPDWKLPGLAALVLHLVVLSLGNQQTASGAIPPLPNVELSFELPLSADHRAASEAPAADANPRPQQRRSVHLPDSVALSSEALPRAVKQRASKAPRSDTSFARSTELAPEAPNVPTDRAAPHQSATPQANREDLLLESLGSAPPTASDTGHRSASDVRSTDAGSISARSPAASTLWRKPKLLSPGVACQGIFKALPIAQDKLTLVLAVNTDGTAAATSVVTGSGVPQAVLRAARSCAKRLRFSPALGSDGRLVVASSVVTLTVAHHGVYAPSTQRHGAI
jgi:hypothetical protein